LPLTPAQLTTLKADIAGNPTLSSKPLNDDGAQAIADFYNALALPAFWVWRTKVTKGDYVNGTSVDGTTFSWAGTGYITRAQGERDAWVQMFDSTGAVNPSQANVRTAFSDIFSGATAPAPANRTHLTTVSRRQVTVAEKLFATGTGSTAAPATMGFEGPVSGADVSQARAV
jgi:hypothetical protein